MDKKRYWTRLANGKEQGPFTAEAVQRSVREGRIPNSALIREGDDGQWSAIRATVLPFEPPAPVFPHAREDDTTSVQRPDDGSAGASSVGTKHPWRGWLTILFALCGVGRLLTAMARDHQRDEQRALVDRLYSSPMATCSGDCYTATGRIGDPDSSSPSSCHSVCVRAKTAAPDIDFVATYKGCALLCLLDITDAGSADVEDCVGTCVADAVERRAARTP